MRIGRLAFFGAVVMSSGLIAGTAFATPAGEINVKPGTFVGTSADCGGAPAGTKKGVSAAWVTGQGLADGGASAHALVLTKSDPTVNCSAAGADLQGVAGQPAQKLGFDYLVPTADTGYCSGGAPRFNVTTSDGGFYFVGGCGNGSPTPAGTDSQGRAWNHVEFDLSSVVAPGSTFASVQLIQDEQGTSVLDNILVNDLPTAGKPGNS